MTLHRMIDGKKVKLTSQEEILLRAKWKANAKCRAENKYKEDRAKNYPKIEEQLDSIFKVIKYLKEKGTDIGIEGESWINQIIAIKEKYPKNE